MQPDFSNIPLHDIHLPPPVSWWPPAPGWWLLLLFIAIIAWVAAWQIKKRRQYRLCNASIKELDALYATYQKHGDAKHFVRDLSMLLRRIHISYFPSVDTAGLVGKAWLVHLDSLLSPKYNKSGQKFSDGAGIVLLSAPYQKMLGNSDIDVHSLYLLSVEWVRSLGPLRKKTSSVPVMQAANKAAHKKEAGHVSV